MNAEQGFYTTELNVYYNRSHEDPQINRKIYHSEYFMKRFKYYKNTYMLFYAIEGKYRVTLNTSSHNVSGRCLIAAKPNTNFSFQPNLDKDFKFLFICIHPSVFKNENIEDNYFRAFEYFTRENQIINLNHKDFKGLTVYFDNICDLISKHYGYCHIKSSCLSAITQMTIVYDTLNNTEFNVKNTAVTIMKYIRKHYTEKISYNTLKEKFSVSAPTINTIVKNTTGMTFYNYITDLRLHDAKQMLRKSWNVSAKDIGNLCGFSSYNAFYKAYLKKYGISPAKEPKTDTALKYWPFSKE